MNTNSHIDLKKRKSKILHQKQTFWQIYFPILIVLLIMLTLCIFIVGGASSGTGQNQVFANIASMYLLIPLLIISLPLIVILIGLIYLITKAFPYIPYYGALIEEKLGLVRNIITRGMDTVSSPFITLPSYLSSIRYLLADLKKGLRRNYPHE